MPLAADMLVLESDFICLRSLAAGAAQLDLALIDPALVCWALFHVLRRLHAIVELQLLHEAFVRVA